jgi:thiamine pyrophosphate-dependent acetolactate synthase large subunit-like protein
LQPPERFVRLLGGYHERARAAMEDLDMALVADALVERLRLWGVARVFGYSGDGIDPILGALQRADGAMQMNGINEMITVASRWSKWEDPRLPILVLHNRDLNEVSWEMREMEGDPRFSTSQDVPEFPYAAYAELLGFKGIRLDDPNDVGDAWDAALGADRPALIEAIVDPAVPLLAPHLQQQQVDHAIAGLEQEGDRDAMRAKRLFESELQTNP